MTWAVTIDAGNIEIPSRIKGLETRPSSEEDIWAWSTLVDRLIMSFACAAWGNPVREINPIRNHLHWTEETLSANVLEF